MRHFGRSRWLLQIAVQPPVRPFWHKFVGVLKGLHAKYTMGKVYLDAKWACLIGLSQISGAVFVNWGLPFRF